MAEVWGERTCVCSPAVRNRAFLRMLAAFDLELRE